MSEEINITHWKKFKVSDFFDIHPTKAYSLTNAQLLDGGDNPVLANSRYNNGIGGFSSLKTTEPGNMITFSDTVDASTIFYQENPFIGYSHVQGLYEKGKYKGKWDKNSLLFFVVVLRRAAKIKGFDYDVKFRRDIALKLDVYLPVDSKGDPDWNSMGNFIEAKKEEASRRLSDLIEIKGNQTPVSFEEWKEFEIQKLFTIKSPQSRTVKDYNEGKTPYVSSGGINNGVQSFLEPKKGEILEKGNCITVSPLEGTPSFYQKEDFLGRGGAGSAISLLYNENLNEYNSLFICCIIKVAAKRFDYSDAFTSDNLKTLKLKLPALKCDDGCFFIDKSKKYSSEGYVPDWKYMEDFMKNIEKISSERLEIIKEIHQ